MSEHRTRIGTGVIEKLNRVAKLPAPDPGHPTATMHPLELKSAIKAGLLTFPVTDFDATGEFRADTYVQRLEWLIPYGATALFAAGGTGAFFSLTPRDVARRTRGGAAKGCPR